MLASPLRLSFDRTLTYGLLISITATALYAGSRALHQTFQCHSNDGFHQKISVTPTLSQNFVSWWMQYALDYSPAGGQNFQAASTWVLSPDVSKRFSETFRAPAAHRTAGHALKFEAKSVAPGIMTDSGVSIVRVIGELTCEDAKCDSTEITVDYAVCSDDHGLRIGAFKVLDDPADGTVLKNFLEDGDSAGCAEQHDHGAHGHTLSGGNI